MNRRRFAFWVGMGLFGLAERLNAASLDGLAAKVMDATAPIDLPPEPLADTVVSVDMPVHWQATHNNTWRWVQREDFVEGEWRITGMTTPVNRKTGEPFDGAEGYLDDDEVPESFRELTAAGTSVGEEQSSEDDESAAEHDRQTEVITSSEPKDHGIAVSVDAPGPDAAHFRKARHGRPPSRWLRSLTTAELSVWLASFEPPKAGVSGMTFYEHLTNDHGFAEEPVAGLTEEEQKKLHGAAHAGY